MDNTRAFIVGLGIVGLIILFAIGQMAASERSCQDRLNAQRFGATGDLGGIPAWGD